MTTSTSNRLAEKLPYAHCSRSRLVCSISKQLMDDVNIPMMLPNGFVYGLHVCIPQSPSSHLTSHMSVSITSLISSLSLFNMFRSIPQSLEKMYEEHGKLICPKTSEIFQISDAVKVFIM